MPTPQNSRKRNRTTEDKAKERQEQLGAAQRSRRDAAQVPLHGLFSCARNVVYVHECLPRPTDFNGPLRLLLLHKAFPLYGDVCNILTLRFGLGDGVPRTLEEVGRKFTVTRERIRQIEAKALRKRDIKDKEG